MPAKSAWLPAEMTELRMTVFMKDAAVAEEWVNIGAGGMEAAR